MEDSFILVPLGDAEERFLSKMQVSLRFHFIKSIAVHGGNVNVIPFALIFVLVLIFHRDS